MNAIDRRSFLATTTAAALATAAPAWAQARDPKVAEQSRALTAFLDAQQAWGREGIGGAAPDSTIAAMFTPYQGALIATLLAVAVAGGAIRGSLQSGLVAVAWASAVLAIAGALSAWLLIHGGNEHAGSGVLRRK